MPVKEINSSYIFTDGEIIFFKVDYLVPEENGFVTDAEVTVKAKREVSQGKYEDCTLELNFSSITSIYINEHFAGENKISDITLKKLENGLFYISLHPFNTTNEPNDKDNFVITAKGFSFDLLNR